MTTIPRFITEALYGQKNFFTTDKSLDEYMLTSVFLEKFAPMNEDVKEINNVILSKKEPEFKEPVNKVNPKSTRFIPHIRDSLFWCMYVFSHGYTVYETQKAIGTNMTNLMMNEKRAMYDFFNKDSGASLKNTNHKITNIKINEIKCDLMTKPLLSSIESLIPCCAYFKRPIYVSFGDNIYLHFVSKDYVADDDSESETVLLYVNQGKFELELDQTVKKTAIDVLREKGYKMPTYEKPLLGLSTYKTDELCEIYDKLFIVDKESFSPGSVVKYKKQDYYDKIAEKCAKKLTEKLV
jgi:hypothetical protein